MSNPSSAPCIDCGETKVRGEDGLWRCDSCGETATDADIREEQREREADNRAWQRELAMEAGMLHGVDAYNDMMGY